MRLTRSKTSKVGKYSPDVYAKHLSHRIPSAEVIRNTGVPCKLRVHFTKRCHIKNEQWLAFIAKDAVKYTTYQQGQMTLLHAHSRNAYVHHALDCGKEMGLLGNPLYKCASACNPPLASFLLTLQKRWKFEIATCPAFICSADQASSCHFDQHSNVMLVLYGKKVVYLSPPDMLVSSGGRKHYNTDATPRNTQFAMKFEIRAGDMLLIPSGWWHYVETKGMTGMLNFFFN